MSNKIKLPHIYLLTLAILALFSSGCSSVYFQDRLGDLRDVLRFGFTYGSGALVNVRVTKLAQVGAGVFEVYKWGIQGRADGFWREYRGEFGVSLVYFTHIEKEFIRGNKTLEENIQQHQQYIQRQQQMGEIADSLRDMEPFYGDRTFGEVGFTVHILGLGLEFALDLPSLLDFFSGWILFDPQNDDLATLKQEKEQLQKEELAQNP
ncbi:MAG: hypothetical protein D6805_04150 [Planctomycetota bacterium]|nr:MAG: hypothetical protein D6805_04150 [Planctomycetota bacterium]